MEAVEALNVRDAKASSTVDEARRLSKVMGR